MKFMKKVGLLLLFALVYLFSATAQETGNGYFVGIGAKGNVYVNNYTTNFLKKGTSLGGELFVGKWFNPVLGARLLLEGGELHPRYLVGKTEGMVKQTYGLGRVDFLLNFTNLFRSSTENQFYNLIPHVGIGGGYAFSRTLLGNVDNTEHAATFLGGGGLLNTFKLTENLSLFVDLNLDVVNQRFDYYYNPNASGLKKFNGIASGSIGLALNFGGGSKTKEVIAPPVEPQAPPTKPAAKPEPKPTPPPTPEPAREVQKAEPFTANVFFRIDRAMIDEEQRINISNMANYLNANPNAKVTVVGYADKETGNSRHNLDLSEKRAKNVAKELVDRYNISSNRITIDWKGDTKQPFSVNAKNRVVILLSE